MTSILAGLFLWACASEGPVPSPVQRPSPVQQTSPPVQQAPIITAQLPTLARPTPCTQQPPRLVRELPMPRQLGRLVGHCISVDGWWRSGPIGVPEIRNGVSGFQVLRVLAFVRETNPSLGGPSWAALDALIVDCGWRTEIPADPMIFMDDPMFVDPIALFGTLSRLNPMDAQQLWGAIEALPGIHEHGPLANNTLGLVLSMNH